MIKKILLSLYILLLPLFLVTFALNLIDKYFPETGIFFSTSTETWERFVTDVTPASWTFHIVAAIFVWQFIWIVYALTFLCRQGHDGPLFLNPFLLTYRFLGIYIFGLFLDVFWLFMFDRELLELSFVISAGLSVTLYFGLADAWESLYESKALLEKHGRHADVNLIRILIHNGIGLYVGWITIATFFNMAAVIAYRSNPPVDQTTAGVIALSFIFVVEVVYISLDQTILAKYSKFTFTPYLALIWACVGILARDFNVNEFITVFSLVILGLAVVALVFKSVFACWSKAT